MIHINNIRAKVRQITSLLGEVEADMDFLLKWKLEEKEKSEDKSVTLVAVVALLLNDEGKVLLTRRSIPPYYGRWVMPGGKISHRENIKKALKREVLEEVGMKIRIETLQEVYEAFPKRGPYSHYIMLFYRARPITKRIKINPDEVVEARWVDAGEYQAYDTPKATRLVLKNFFQDETPEKG